MKTILILLIATIFCTSCAKDDIKPSGDDSSFIGTEAFPGDSIKISLKIYPKTSLPDEEYWDVVKNSNFVYYRVLGDTLNLLISDKIREAFFSVEMKTFGSWSQSNNETFEITTQRNAFVFNKYSIVRL